MTFGENVVRYRELRGLKQKELAELIDVSPSRLNYWEKDKREPDMLLARRIAKVLGVTTDDLIGDDNFELPDHPSILKVTTQRVPLLGEIACGEPIFASEDLTVMVDAPIPCDFALRCKGDSMIDARILDGDLVFVRKQDAVDDGAIAAVLIDDEATLKRVYHLSDGRVELRAANARYAPIILGGENDTRSFRIMGKAVGFQSIFL